MFDSAYLVQRDFSSLGIDAYRQYQFACGRACPAFHHASGIGKQQNCLACGHVHQAAVGTIGDLQSVLHAISHRRAASAHARAVRSKTHREADAGIGLVGRTTQVRIGLL